MAALNQPIFRIDHNGYYAEQNYYMEKRQLFLRSYQFCRKRSVADRIKTSFIRVKRVICLRLRSARKFRKLVWSRLRYAFYYKRRRFLRLLNMTHHHRHHSLLLRSDCPSSCFW
ncbi:uncharacterized protein LOC104881376 [Vitis vinifera]|uniref:uncharacterized protein LOC104881376 n=1 Tax=Vitis vinifera TaxID=29760 RepID=UPI00053F4CB3|nr:uncharacterized protein LOC104881376 [Vitis vinifera]|eukprot:XP_010659785.1 PREDICTED: uncharacterized protein LOC104881376 [Vitis vinifera]